MKSEKELMDRIYRRRIRQADKYSLANKGNRYNFEVLKDRISSELYRLFSGFADLKLLDLGAGELAWVERFIELGFSFENTMGTDILLWRLKKGRRQGRSAQALVSSATALPFPDNGFDVVTQMTLMTSILDDSTRQAIAAEMNRVVRPGGYILWYDFRFNNPGNPDTRAIGLSEIERLFSGWAVRAEKITLLPPLARKVGRLPSGLLNLISRLPILRTHYLAIIGPKG